MVLNWKKVEGYYQVRGGSFPQEDEFKHLGILFTTDGRI